MTQDMDSLDNEKDVFDEDADSLETSFFDDDDQEDFYDELNFDT